MNLRNIFVPVLVVSAWVLGYAFYGGRGVAMVGGGVLMWALLHVTQMMGVLKRASRHPVGYVPSAVMLNAKLSAGMGLLHVVALTRSLGESLSEPDAQPEVYQWTDPSYSRVSCEFLQGQLVKWALVRPGQEADQQAGVAP